MNDRDALRAIVQAAVTAVEPRAAVRRAFSRYREMLALPDDGRVRVAACGKAAAGMVLAVLDETRVSEGSVTVPAGSRPPPLPPQLTLWEASHPLPGAHSLAAAADALGVARRAAAGEVLLCLVSGGASSLWAAPAGALTLTDLAGATRAMLHAGVPIQEMNAMRRHLSRIGGGWLAHAAAPARVVTLAISDVVGSSLEVIGSGPAVPDISTFQQALAIAREVAGVPAAVLAHLQAGAAGDHPETPGPDAPCFVGCSALVVADNRDALAATAAAADAWGYPAEVVPEPLAGDAAAAGRRIAALVEARRGGEPRALVLGGETVVKVRGPGRGGRSQELALALAVELAGVPGWCALAFGTDGVDGPTPAAGAFVDGGTVQRGATAGADAARALERNDSYGFFSREGGALVTGPTGTNVADVVVVLLGGAQL